MPFRDLREFIAALGPLGEVETVEGADPHLEIGTISELNYERRGPALLFDHIKGYPRGYRILTNALESLPRALLALDLPPTLRMDEAVEAYEHKMDTYSPVPPVEVESGPVLDNVFMRDQIDLEAFPTPFWHEEDGGRYIGTGCIVIQRHPDTGAVNLGTYRVMVHDKTTAGLYISPHHSGAIIEKMYWERGQSCPVAVAFGMDPLLFVAGASYFRDEDIPEYELVGHVRGAPVEVIREEVTGLPIPATAEIVIAGEVPPPDVVAQDEGPFGEWTGYYASGTRPEPVIRIHALYHRNAPIILGMPPVKPLGPTSHFGIVTDGGNYKEQLGRAGVEEVLDVCRLSTPGVIVIQLRQRYPGHAMKAALGLVSTYMAHVIIVVDEDINPHDPNDVLWAVGTRCDPATTVSILGGCNASALDPRIPPERKARGDFTSSKLIINACKPYDWKDEFPKTNVASPALRRQVLTKWTDLFPSG